MYHEDGIVFHIPDSLKPSNTLPMARLPVLLITALSLIFSTISCNQSERDEATPANEHNRIQPYAESPFYWQYAGEPVMLLGASNYHNIFQRPDMVEELEMLETAGGNYVRNSMASREIFPDHRDLWPFKAVEATDDTLINIYDLTEWNERYWENLERLLRETYNRNIILEIELWERHDYYRTRDQAGWIRHPYNPANNINYSEEESGFPVGEIDYVDGDPASRTIQIRGEDGEEKIAEGHPFFSTVPDLEHNEVVLPYQEAFIDNILSYTLEYDHVLYNMNNETREPNEWGEYWANYILDKARAKGIQIELTDMQDAHDVTDESVARMMDSELFTFVDISQNNFQSGDLHWERIRYIHDYLLDHPKPITNIKVYGTDHYEESWNTEFWGTAQDAVERYWRNMLGGTSSTRFHRPPWGIGINETARTHVQSARMFTEKFDIIRAEPANELIDNRVAGSAYLSAVPGEQYAVYFPNGGHADIQFDEVNDIEIEWLDASSSRWAERENRQTVRTLELTAPVGNHWIAIISVR